MTARRAGMPRARATALMAGLLGLAALLSAAPVPIGAAYAVFGMLAVAWCRTVARPGVSPAGADPRWAANAAAIVALLGLAVSFHRIDWRLGGLTLFGAMVEELVFRRELPDALAVAFGTSAGRWRGAVAGTLAAQAVFAACHFLAPAHPRAFGPGLPFVRLVAGGACLAVLYRASGTLLLPAAVHFWINATVGGLAA